jgi:cytochrome c-type biogenesis protein CcmE
VQILKPKNQRLILAIFAIVALSGAGFLALAGLKDKAAYFYTPTDISAGKVAVGKAMRLGGMVSGGSIVRDSKTLTVSFNVEDGNKTVPVVFRGITPDLFKERSGVIAEGEMSADGKFIASNLLAKHDEKYMPPQMAGVMKNKGKTEK